MILFNQNILFLSGVDIMVFSNQKYKVTFNEKGAITSLLSGSKEFVRKILPLFQFRMREGAKVSLYNSDMADNIVSTESLIDTFLIPFPT